MLFTWKEKQIARVTPQGIRYILESATDPLHMVHSVMQ